MTPEELIEAVSKMTSGDWAAHDHWVVFTPRLGGFSLLNAPSPKENATGIVALRNHAVRIIQSLIYERDAALARVAELEGDRLRIPECDIGWDAGPDENVRDAGPTPYSGRTTRREG